MNPGTVSDLEVNRNVRRVLVRHRIDLGWLTLATTRGTVRLGGSMRRVPGTPELTPPILDGLFREIRHAPGVHRADVDLQNWSHDGFLGNWKPRGTPESAPLRSPDVPPPATYDVR